MRGSGWLIAAPMVALWLASAGYPLVALAGSAGVASDETRIVQSRDAGELLITSLGWSAVVAAGAMALGWAPGRLLGRLAGRRARTPTAIALLAPLCLPAYVVFFAWWQSWPPDSGLHRWAVEHGHIGLLREATLLVGLLCWSWPIVAWCVGATGATAGDADDELLELDRVGLRMRLRLHLRADRRGLAVGGLIVFLLAFNNTTCFDLAQIFTFGNELRAIRALGATPGGVLVAALPAVAVAVIGAAAIWAMLGGRGDRRPRRRGAPGVAAWSSLGVMLLVSTIVPLGLLGRDFTGWGRVTEFLDLYGRGLGNTIVLAVVCGLLVALATVGLAACWQDHRRWVRSVAHGVALTWLLAAIVPATVVVSALEAAYNPPASGVASPASSSDSAATQLGSRSTGIDSSAIAHMIYREPIILVLGHLARFGFIAALLGRLAASREPESIRQMRRLDDATTLRGLLLTGRPALGAAAIAAAMIVIVLSISEIAVTAQLQPPGFEAIAASILNDLHYQRPQTVMVASGIFVAAAVAAATVAVVASATRRRGSVAVLAGLMAVAGSLVGCGSDGDSPAALETRMTFGSPGRGLGQFSYPRAIAVDASREFVFVIDKTARVQRFGFDGVPQLQWDMPARDSGKPTGVSVAPDGRVFVADTHYYRVIAYDAEGVELMRFGEYGTEPGQFLLPTDIAFGPEGRLYVSEYGGNDRIQVFDASGEFLFSFGSFGWEGEEMFNRPQSMTFNADLTELYIADSCNHRIVVVDPAGRTLRSFGEPGRAPGDLSYPYDLMMLADGTLLVCEFGNNRVQRFSPAGAFLGVYGRVGPGDGELQYPWGVDGTEDRIFVLDSGNHRVQVIDAL